MKLRSSKDIALPNVVVAIDADNTLWDTNTIFAKAQLHLLGLIETETKRLAIGNKLKFIRAIDQELALLHNYDLRYPPHILVKATINVLLGLPLNEAARLAIDSKDSVSPDVSTYTAAFLGYLKTEIPRLRRGVRRGLAKLNSRNYHLVIVTESNHGRCGMFLEKHNLRKYIHSIYEVKKSTDAYKKLLLDFPNAEAKVMIGDQLDRDIIPAKHAAFFTIYFPGGFNPTWTPNQEPVWFDQQISSFAEVPDIVDRYIDLEMSAPKAPISA